MIDIAIENLKCCGNCYFRHSLDMGDYHSEICKKKYHTESNCKCSKWRFDLLTALDRDINE